MLVAIRLLLARNCPNLSPFEFRFPFPKFPTLFGYMLFLPVPNWALESIPMKIWFLLGKEFMEFWRSV